ncbi:MAG: GNAT family N-acetyltransferase [Chloroflexota bacterium]|nr:MAG: GNAT family N-acetyltransferase [Chloroflexota bacterium]
MAKLDLSSSEIPGRIQQNLIAYMRLFAGLPGMVMEDSAHPDEETFWFVSNKPAPGNSILRARWRKEGVEDRIDALFAEIGRNIDEIDWMVYPGDQPADLGRRLEARGMQGGPGGNWLWTGLASLVPAPTTPDGFHIERVIDDRMMAEWVRVSEAGFEGELGCFYDAYARHGYGPGAFSLHYTGYLGDIPVTSGTLLDAGGTAAIYDVSTPREYRRQGLGGAITHALMAEIQRRGYGETWIWSSDIARSVYQKLGFVEADFGVREYHWRKNTA